MGRPAFIAALIALGVVWVVGVAHATPVTLTFEDLWSGGLPLSGTVPNSYHGFTWNVGTVNPSWTTKTGTLPAPSGFNNTIDGNVGIFVASGDTAGMERTARFSVRDLLLGGVYNDGESTWLYGYRDGTLVDSAYVAAPFTGSTVTLRWNGISELLVAPDTSGTHHSGVLGFGYKVVLDDITYDVPEPGTLALVGFGLAGLLAWRRRGRGKR